MLRRPLFLALFLSTSTLGLGCVQGGSKQSKAADKAYAAGDLEAADQAYGEALAADPNNADALQKRKKVRGELAARHRDQAKTREQAQDWAGASAAWGRAAEMDPDTAEYAVRRDLSALKAKNLGPDEWYDGVAAVYQRYAGNPIAEKSYAGARAQAYQHNVNLAEQFLIAGDGGRAFTHFERAKTIDPSTPGLRADSYGKAEALAKAEQGDVRLAAGDAVGAYELYQAAYARMPLPEIQKKLAQVKAQASAMLNKLDQAKQKADRGQYEEALKIYESIKGNAGVPPSVEAEIARLKDELQKRDLEAAKKAAERGDLKGAHRSLVAAVKSGRFDKVTNDAAILALDQIRDGAPAKGLERAEASGVPPGPLTSTIRTFALASARAQVEKARGLSKRDPSKANELLSELATFEADLPELEELRKSLRSGSFAELLDEALRSGKAGNDAEAASLLLAALNSSAAPDNMRVPAQEGCDALKAQRYVEAERAFAKAMSAAPKSRLAQRGIDIARLRRAEAERRAVEQLSKGGDDAAAVAVLEATMAFEPTNPSVKKGAELLLGRIKGGERLPTAELAALIANGARLQELPAPSKNALFAGVQALGNEDLAGAEKSFGEATSAAPSAELPKLAKELTQRRATNKLKDQAKSGTPEALAELIRRDRSSADAKEAMRSLLSQAKAAAEKKEFAEAARFLGVAGDATSPAPGVKKALDAGNAALTAGKLADAETAYGEALELEPASEVAQTGQGIAKKERLAGLNQALTQAKSGGNTDEARAALKATLERDPASPEARAAFDELIAEAQRQSAAGNDRQAAQLLDTANVVSKPETVQQAIGRANGLLGESKHEEAAKAYQQILEKGESRVAKAGQAMAKDRWLSALYLNLAELEKGGDLERGAKAAVALRAVDPNDPKVLGAVRATLLRAEKAASNADDLGAARDLSAAAKALGEEALQGAIDAFSAGRYADAEANFKSGGSSELARRGAALARGRRLGTLKAGLGSDGLAQAESIRALREADPASAEAKKAFLAMLDKAKKSAQSGNYPGAAETLDHATYAIGASEALSEATKVGTTHLGENRFAEAEKAFLDALEIVAGAEVPKAGVEIAKAARLKEEKDAEKGLSGADPRGAARRLTPSRLVEPNSKVVAKALAEMQKRAEAAAKKGQDPEAGQALEAAGILEADGAELLKALTEAAAAYAKAGFEEAENAFAAKATVSKTAALGQRLSRQRRVALLRGELEQARKDKDVLRQSALVGQVLALDPNDTLAKSLEKTVKGDLKGSRVEAAKAQRAAGKLGVAWVYLKRALALDPNDGAAKAELAEVEAKLKSQSDLVLVVEPITRDSKVASGVCKGFEDALRTEVMSVASKEENLGAYVLSPSWTEAVEKKDSRAPEVGGHLTLTMTQCSISPGTGKTKLSWRIEAPPKGASIAKGELEAELPSGLIPRDEQDGASKNATNALVKRAGKSVTESLGEARGDTALWLLTLAEHQVKANEPALAAEAYAKMVVKGSKSADPARLDAVQAYLDGAFK